jgi:SAM-dependent methyltransferase
MEEFVNNASKHQCLAKEIDVEDYTWKNFTKNIVEVFKIAEEEYKDFKVKKICNLGSGNDKMIGAVNVDIRSKTNPEIITDLNLDFWPIGVDYDEIYAMSIMEHLPNIISAMKNVYRILKNDGLFVMKVPYYKSITAFIDPTHVRFFTEQSMDYFDQSTYYGSINNYAEVNFKILEIKFIDNLPDENYRDLLFVMQKKEYIEN